MKDLLPITKQLIQELKEYGRDHLPCGRLSNVVHVLVVEDDDNDAQMITRTLREICCEVDLAKDGIEAAQMLKENQGKYCIMFLDIGLPGMDGIGVLRIAQRVAPEVHVIIVTGGNRIGEIPPDCYYGVVRKPLREKLALEILDKTARK